MKNISTLLLLLLSVIFISCVSSKANDDITINVGPEPKTIDPTLNSAVDGSIYIHHAFEGLATKDKEDKITPGAAENWDISEDGTKYIFYIRSNAKWSDGKPVKASDFVYAWRRAVDPLIASEYSYQLDPVKNAEKISKGDMPISSLGVKAIDDNTLEVTLESPTAYFLELTAFPTYFPVRKDVIDKNKDKWTLNPSSYIGNGPFVMKERKIDDKIVMEKNTNYWNNSSIVPNKLVFILMQNETAQVAGIKDGSIDFANNPPQKDLESLKNEGYLIISPYIGTYYYAINITNKVLKDPRIRKALSLAIDRNYIVEQVTKGGQTPATAWVPLGIDDVEGSFRKIGGDYYGISKEYYGKNIEEAKTLLKEAGYENGNGFPVLEFKTNPGNHVELFEAIQQMWKENLGIDTTISQEEWAVFQQSRNDKNFEIARHGLIGDYNDPMTFMGVFLSYSPQNNGGYSNTKYDSLLKKAMSTGDQNVRMKLMHEAEDILMNDMALIPIYFYTDPLLVNKELNGVIYDPLGSHKFFYANFKK